MNRWFNDVFFVNQIIVFLLFLKNHILLCTQLPSLYTNLKFLIILSLVLLHSIILILYITIRTFRYTVHNIPIPRYTVHYYPYTPVYCTKLSVNSNIMYKVIRKLRYTVHKYPYTQVYCL